MNSLKGHLLIASPKLLDPNFLETVVFMVQHDDDGALGLVLNRPTSITVLSAWERVCEKPCRVEGVIYQGGPCEGPLMVVHRHDSASQVEVIEGVHFSSEPEKIEWLAEHGESPMKFVVGYSGWGPGQLEREMQEDAWIAQPATAEQVFSEGKELWSVVMKAVLARSGVRNLRPNIIPSDPSLN